jgi:hypothetical protein
VIDGVFSLGVVDCVSSSRLVEAARVHFEGGRWHALLEIGGGGVSSLKVVDVVSTLGVVDGVPSSRLAEAARPLYEWLMVCLL